MMEMKGKAWIEGRERHGEMGDRRGTKDFFEYSIA